MGVKVFGHESIVRGLEEFLPPVSLFRGPPSVGKWTVAEYLAEYHGVKPVDLRKIEKLDADAARDLKNFAYTAPFGSFKLVIAQLDKASETALNALLKLLEEPPPSIRFILVCVYPPLDTIMSRSHVFRFGILDKDDLRSVLVDKVGMSPAHADAAADLGRGQVAPALLAEQNDNTRASVLSILKAIADGDEKLLDHTVGSWKSSKPGEPDHAELVQQLLVRWCVEAITNRWQVFNNNETFGLTKTPVWPRKILIALRYNARPKLAIRTGLMPLLAERRNAA